MHKVYRSVSNKPFRPTADFQCLGMSLREISGKNWEQVLIKSLWEITTDHYKSFGIT